MDKKSAGDEDDERSFKRVDSSISPKNRRRVENAFGDDSKGDKEAATSSESTKSSIQDQGGDNEAAAKPRRKRTGGNNDSAGGWMNTSTSTKNLNNSIATDVDGPNAEVVAQSGASSSSNNKNKHFQEDDEDVMIIPDLDEEGGGDSDHRIAHAPRNVYRKIPTLGELEAEAKSTAATNDDDLPGLQLRVLTSTLVPGNMLTERDEEWTFDSLLREITNELSDVPKPAPRKKEAGKESTKEKSKGKEKESGKASKQKGG